MIKTAGINKMTQTLVCHKARRGNVEMLFTLSLVLGVLMYLSWEEQLSQYGVGDAQHDGAEHRPPKAINAKAINDPGGELQHQRIHHNQK